MGKKKFDYVEGGKSALYINEVNCVRRTLSLFLKKAALKKDVQLKDYQQRAVDKIKRQGSLLVAHGTGTGKTVTGIGGFETLRGEGKASKALVVVPASLRTNFAEHGVRKFTDSTVQVIDRGNQEVDPNVDYVIVSNTLFASDPVKYSKGRDTLIVDEAHNFRNASTKSGRALQKHMDGFKNRILLTASPFNNRPSDLAPLLNVTKGRKVYDPSVFNKKYVKERRKRMGFLGLGGEGLDREVFIPDSNLKQDLKTWVDYERGEDDLPKTTKEVVRVPMTPEQIKAYRYAWGRMPRAVRTAIKHDIIPEKRDNLGFFAAIANARVASNNPAALLKKYHDSKQGYKISGKIKQLLEDLEQEGELQDLVYSNYNRHGAEMIRQALEDKGKRVSQISGQMSRKQKDVEIKDFKKGKKDVFITTPTGKEGISLPNVGREIIFDPHWNPEVTRQAIGRGVRADSLADQINIREYIAVEPDKRLLGFIGRKPTPSVEEWVKSVADKKRDLQKQVLSYL